MELTRLSVTFVIDSNDGMTLVIMVVYNNIVVVALERFDAVEAVTAGGCTARGEGAAFYREQCGNYKEEE